VDVVVLAKYVPNPSGLPPEIGPDFRLRREDPNGGLDPSDEPAVEVAVRLCEERGGEVTAVSVGPELATRALWRSLALGADRGVLVSDGALSGADSLATARALAAAISRQPYDLVVAGVESTDAATGTMPIVLAELLVLPAATFGVDRAAVELLTKARTLDPDVAAVALGRGAADAAGVLGEYGARTVYADENDVYSDYPGEPAAYTLAELARRHEPDLVLFGSAYDSRDVAGRLQGLLGTTLVANADDIVGIDRVRLTVALRLWPGRPGNLRGGIGGAKTVDVSLGGPAPRLVLARPAAFAAVRSRGEADVVAVEVEVPAERKRARRWSAMRSGARACGSRTRRSSSRAGAAWRRRRTSSCSSGWRARSATPPSAPRDRWSTPAWRRSRCRSARRARRYGRTSTSPSASAERRSTPSASEAPGA
jgi:electron transfer flavoprotein alpha/beta subunit